MAHSIEAIRSILHDREQYFLRHTGCEEKGAKRDKAQHAFRFGAVYALRAAGAITDEQASLYFYLICLDRDPFGANEPDR